MTQQALDVGGERFVVVGTVLLLLKMLVEYCESAADMPLAAADLLARLIELLKVSDEDQHFENHSSVLRSVRFS